MEYYESKSNKRSDYFCGYFLRDLCLDLDGFVFFFNFAAATDTELSSSSSSSRGTGHKSSRILGSGLTSTVTGLGFLGKLEKSANSSTGGTSSVLVLEGSSTCGITVF